MNTNFRTLNVRSFLGAAAVAACAVLSGPVQAEGHQVTVKISVNTTGFDLNQPAVAREVYGRLRRAAFTVCRDGGRVDLEPVTSFTDCYETALGKAIGSAHQPQLSMIYLATHTARAAASYGIEISTRMASK